MPDLYCVCVSHTRITSAFQTDPFSRLQTNLLGGHTHDIKQRFLECKFSIVRWRRQWKFLTTTILLGNARAGLRLSGNLPWILVKFDVSSSWLPFLLKKNINGLAERVYRLPGNKGNGSHLVHMIHCDSKMCPSLFHYISQTFYLKQCRHRSLRLTTRGYEHRSGSRPRRS